MTVTTASLPHLASLPFTPQTTLTSESLMSLLCRVHKDASVVVFICQAVLVLLTVFGGGVFIRPDVTPLYWRWLQAISPIAQAASATIIQVSNFISYECATLNGVCTGPYEVVFPCDARPDDGERCFVSGRTVLYITQGVSQTDSPWAAYKYLILILVACRVAVLLLMIMPPDRLAAWLKKKFSADTNDVVMKGMSSIRRIEGMNDESQHLQTIHAVSNSPHLSPSLLLVFQPN
jgi:hypothetical protein